MEMPVVMLTLAHIDKECSTPTGKSGVGTCGMVGRGAGLSKGWHAVSDTGLITLTMAKY